MVTYENVNLSKNLVHELEDIAKSKNTDINNTVKLILEENKELKNPSYLTTTKISKNKSTYSSVIPAPIKNKFNLSKGQVLYWDIEDNKIIITPDRIGEDLPETQSIKAGSEILKDFLFNNNNQYGTYSTNILSQLNSKLASKNPEEVKERILSIYINPSDGEERDQYTKVILYLLDQPLEVYKHEILQGVYTEITKQNTSD